jgi:hypothetical protein
MNKKNGAWAPTSKAQTQNQFLFLIILFKKSKEKAPKVPPTHME